MAAVPKLDVNIARKFHPFDSQSVKKVQEIIEKSAVQKLPADRMLFKQGDNDKWTIYLLSGKVEKIEGLVTSESSFDQEPSADQESPISLDENLDPEDSIVAIDDPAIIEDTSDNQSLSLSEQLALSEESRQKATALAVKFKGKAQEAIKFAKVKAKQLELLKQKLQDTAQRAAKAEAEVKKLRAEIEQFKSN